MTPQRQHGHGGSSRTRRLDHGFTVVSTRVLIAAFVVFLWIVPWLPGKNRGSPPTAFYPIVAVVSVVLFLWLRRMRQVSFDGEQFIIKDWFSRPVEVPKSQLIKVRAIPLNKGMSWLTLKFQPATEFGAAVRVMTGETWKTDKFLRMADEMNAIAERRPPKEPRLVTNDKSIDVRGWSKTEIQEIIADFTARYDMADLQITFSEPGSGVVGLRFPGDIEPRLFIFLVNYLHYPEHFDLRLRSISARGTCTLTPAFNLPEAKLAGNRATFFVPSNDTEYDFVMVKIDSGETYRIPFTNLRWKLEPSGRPD